MHTKSIAVGNGKGKRWAKTPKGAAPADDCLTLSDVIKMLGYADRTKEAKNIIQSGLVRVDGDVCKDPARALGLMDIIQLQKIGKSYRVSVQKKNLVLTEIAAKDAKNKLCRVIGKKVLAGNKVQVNLHDGTNILYDKPVSVNDTIILKIPDRKVDKILPYEVGKQAIIVSGRHRGETGKITEIVGGTASRKSQTTVDEIQTLTEYAFVVGADKSLV